MSPTSKPAFNREPASISKMSSTTEISARPAKFQTSNAQPKYNTQRAPITKLNITNQPETKPTMTLRALCSPRVIPVEKQTSVPAPRAVNRSNPSSTLSSPRTQHNDEAPPAAVSSPPSFSPRSPRSEPTFLPIKGTSSTVAKQGDSNTVPSSENEIILVKSTYQAESKSAPLLLQSVTPKTPPSTGHTKHMSFNTMVAGIVGHDVSVHTSCYCLLTSSLERRIPGASSGVWKTYREDRQVKASYSMKPCYLTYLLTIDLFRCTR